jgi:hypothetical protein
MKYLPMYIREQQKGEQHAKIERRRCKENRLISRNIREMV